jgi:putative tricarboxylic transport membrane protein
MKKYGFSVAGMVLGLVLGSLIEENIRKTLIITGGNWIGLFLRPIAGPIFLACVITLLFPQIKKLFSKKGKTETLNK